MRPGVDIALVSLGTTPGLRRSDEAFASLVRRAGATCEVVPVRIGAAGRLRRHAAVTDLVEALAARRSARGIEARAVVYSTITAALLQPAGAAGGAPYGIRFDAIAALNRPGAAGAWQRRRERGVLERARLLMPVSRGAEEAVAGYDRPRVRVPIPIEPIEGAAERDIDAVAYASYPRKRGLEVLCAAWPGGRLVIGGADRAKGMAWLRRHGVPEPEGVEWAGDLPREEWLDRVRRARLFVNASRWEDFGIAPMEALSAGTPVASVAAAGSFEALPMLRELEPGLVAERPEALGEAIGRGLALSDEERARYARRAADLLAPYREDAIAKAVAEQVLPGLGIEP